MQTGHLNLFFTAFPKNLGRSVDGKRKTVLGRPKKKRTALLATVKLLRYVTAKICSFIFTSEIIGNKSDICGLHKPLYISVEYGKAVQGSTYNVNIFVGSCIVLQFSHANFTG